MRPGLRHLRQQLALVIAPWLELPLPFDSVDLRKVGPTTEAAAIIGGQTWVRECLARGFRIADSVTILYVPPEGLDAHGNGYRITSIRRDEPGVSAAGRRREGDETEPSQWG